MRESVEVFEIVISVVVDGGVVGAAITTGDCRIAR